MSIEVLAGIGDGFSTLGQGLDRLAMRRLAEKQQRIAQARQAQQDALEKAKMQADEFRLLDTLNYRPASNTDILNNVALQKPFEEYQSGISGKRFVRNEGMAPSDLRMQNEQDKRDAAMRLLQERTNAQQEIANLREGGMNRRWDTQSANTEANNTTRMAIAALAAQSRENAAALRQQPAAKPLPSSHQKVMDEMLDTYRSIQRAKAAVELPEAERAFGFSNALINLAMPGPLEEPVKNMLDPKGVGARSDIAEVASTIRKIRLGSAQSKQEMSSLAPVLPSDANDLRDLRKKLPLLEARYKDMIRNRARLWRKTFDTSEIESLLGDEGGPTGGATPAASAADALKTRMQKIGR